MTLHATLITLFPEMFPGALGYSLTGRALEEGRWSFDAITPRDFGHGKHRQVDDTPYGGGAGMVLRADVMDAAIQKGLESHPESKLIYFSPRGVPFNQPLAKQLSQEESLLMICGRFEAVDERVIDKYQPLEISLGDFVMTGGEYAAMAVLDAAIRLLPGVIGEAESLEQESFGMAEDYALLLEHPHYTRPPVWEERPVPEVLLSGNHGEINAWRKRLSEEFTKARRPDLWKRYNEGNES